MKKLSDFIKFDTILSHQNYQYLYNHLKNNKFNYCFLDHFIYIEESMQNLLTDLYLLGSLTTGINLELVFLYINDIDLKIFYIPEKEFTNLVLSKNHLTKYSFYKTNDTQSDSELEQLILSNLKELDEYYKNEITILNDKIEFSKLLD